MQVYNVEKENWKDAGLSMVVVGASGDLAKKKIYPALFALYVEGHMPEHWTIWGFARSKMTHEEFREYIGTSLSCRLTDKGKCENKFDSFLERCYYHPGQYSNRDDFAALSDKMSESEQVSKAEIPPCHPTCLRTLQSISAQHRGLISVTIYGSCVACILQHG